jgi:flavin-binding protein dodecin
MMVSPREPVDAALSATCAGRGRCAYDGSSPAPKPAGPAAAKIAKGEKTMAKKGSTDGVYRVIDVIGTSAISWEDAAKTAVSTASKSLRDLRIAEVSKLDMKVEGGKVVAYRARVQLSFKYES